MQAPVTVFTQGAKRESGKKAQFGNIMAAKVREVQANARRERPERARLAPCCSFLLDRETDRIPCLSSPSLRPSINLPLKKTPIRPSPTSSAPRWARARCSRCSWTRPEVSLWGTKGGRGARRGALAIDFFFPPAPATLFALLPLNPFSPSKPPKLQTSSPGIVLTNDGNAILREIDVSHPAAKVRGLEKGREKEGGEREGSLACSRSRSRSL